VSQELSNGYRAQYGPADRSIFLLSTIDSVDTPDYSTAQTVVLVGGGEGDAAVVMPGTMQRYWFDADKTTMYVLTVGAEYDGQVVDPASLTTYLTAIDLITGAAWEAGPVAADGRIYDNDFWFYGQGVTIGEQQVYLTTQVMSPDGTLSTQTTIVDRQTGAKLGTIELEGTPAGDAIANADGTRALQLTEVVDAAGEESTTLWVIDPATATLVGNPIVFDGARHAVTFTADGSHILVVTQPGTVYTGGEGGPGGPGVLFHGPTTFTLVDASTGAVVGDPLTVDGTFGSWTLNLGEDGDRAYVTMYSRDEGTNVYTYATYVLDVDGRTIAV